MSPHVGEGGGKWIELNPIRTMDDTTILSRLLQRLMVVNLCSNLFEKLKLAEISGLASGTASGGGSDIDDPLGLVANVQNESCEKAVGNVPSTTAQALSTQRECILLMRVFRAMPYPVPVSESRVGI